MESLASTGFSVFAHPIQQHCLTDTPKTYEDNALRRHAASHTLGGDTRTSPSHGSPTPVRQQSFTT
jgi:hypothetical protein